LISLKAKPCNAVLHTIDTEDANSGLGLAAGKTKQEAQLMLTNPRDAVRGQSRSPRIVPFYIFGIVSY